MSRQELRSTGGNCQGDDRQESCSSAGNCQADEQTVIKMGGGVVINVKDLQASDIKLHLLE